MNLEILKLGAKFNLSRPFNKERFGTLSTLEFSWLLIIEFKCLYFDIGFYNHQDVYTTDSLSSFICSGRLLIDWCLLLPRHYHCCRLVRMSSVRVGNLR